MRLNSTASSLKKSVHISVMFMTLPRFSWDYKDLFKTGCRPIKITIYTYCYDFMMCVICDWLWEKGHIRAYFQNRVIGTAG